LNVSFADFADIPADDMAPRKCFKLEEEIMEFLSGHIARQQQISELFTAAFSASEGADEGQVIGDFIRNLMQTTPNDDLFVWSAYEGDLLLGCIFLSRLTYEQDDRTVFILSPVAVRTDRQKTGIGRHLIAHGLEHLRKTGVDFVVTYGDPNYYSRTGFRQISEKFAQAPLKLSFPDGWLAQSLSNQDERPLIGPARCVPALNKPELW
jgi:putative acetyltransferase